MPTPRHHLERFALVLAGWTAFGLLSAAQSQLQVLARGESRPLGGILLLSLVGSWIWALYTPVVAAFTRRARGVRESIASRPRAWLAYLGLHLAFAAVVIAIDVPAWAAVRPLLDGARPSLARVFAGTLLINVFSYVAVVTLTEAADSAARWRERERTAASLERTAEALRRRLEQARLHALESQLRPHFLYNTLNVVAELVHSEPEAADAMLTQLGALLRRSYREGAALVPLREEIDFVRAYGEILARRYRDRVRLTIAVPPELLASEVPSWVLQPLVENAFRHGVEHRERPSDVEVLARERAGELQLRVRDREAGWPREHALVDGLTDEDEGAGISAVAEEGIGLRNTRERLALLYGASAGLTLVRTARETIASVRLPLWRGVPATRAAADRPHAARA
ncbi:MAG TPA: histidine kinase [Gemmatimonadaceae bacterium]|nr:histidine kinase [Gemmatimonadaceae bacterium]